MPEGPAVQVRLDSVNEMPVCAFTLNPTTPYIMHCVHAIELPELTISKSFPLVVRLNHEVSSLDLNATG